MNLKPVGVPICGCRYVLNDGLYFCSLHAAAPNLLAACQMLVDDPGITESANDVIKFAIAKAKGETL